MSTLEYALNVQWSKHTSHDLLVADELSGERANEIVTCERARLLFHRARVFDLGIRVSALRCGAFACALREGHAVKAEPTAITLKARLHKACVCDMPSVCHHEGAAKHKPSSRSRPTAHLTNLTAATS